MSSIDDHRVWREVREALIGLEERSRDPALQTALAVALAANGEAVAAQLVRHMIAIVHGMSRAQAHVAGGRPTDAAKIPPLHSFADLISLHDGTEPKHSSPSGSTHLRNDEATQEKALTVDDLAPSVQQLAPAGPPFRAGHLLKPEATRQAFSRALHGLSETAAKTAVRYGVQALAHHPNRLPQTQDD